jgi:O-antigen ligase
VKNKFFKNLTSNTPKGFWVISVLFILLLASAFLFREYYLVPIAFLPFLAYYSFYEFENLYFFAVFLTPLSIGLDYLAPNIGFNISLPTEILLFLILLILIIKILKGGFFDSKIFTHPLCIAVFIYLGWILITSITSSMPLVSIKHLIAKCWFIFPLFFLPILLFKNKKNIFWFMGLYIVAFLFIILKTTFNHINYGLYNKDAAQFVMQPFYNDHTSYGAVLAFYIPALYGLLFIKSINSRIKVVILAIAVIYSVALVLSYTRAAWISVLGAVFLAIVLLLKIQIRYILALAAVAITLLFIYRIEIIDKLNKNKQDSSAEISEHIKSISNIATDASNLERINRWNCAIAMFKERPILGWGPGTYMFQYAPFQKARDKTVISTNFAEGGNAHSEFIGPLAEQGFPGFLTFLILIITFYYIAFKLYFKTVDFDTKLLVMICLLSLTTYIIHGTLNNYLDTDKASVPFWGFLSIICSIDLYHKIKIPQLGGAEER